MLNQKDKNYRLLVADDEIKLHKLSQDNFTKRLNLPNLDTEFVGNCQEALERVRDENPPNIIIVDIKMPDKPKNSHAIDAGKTLIDEINKVRPEQKTIIASAYFSYEDVEQYIRKYKNVLNYFPKPLKYPSLKQLIQETLELSLPKEKKFDYNDLDLGLSNFVRQKTGEIKFLIKRSAQDIFEIGTKLKEVKEELPHGYFELWTVHEFEMSKKTARRFMAVAKAFKSVNLTDLTITPTALYELSATSTPESVREEAIARAKAKEVISYTLVETLKEKYSLSTQLPPKTVEATVVDESILVTPPTRAGSSPVVCQARNSLVTSSSFLN